MRTGNTTAVEELQIIGRFEGLRNMLLSEPYGHHLEKCLAYWALPTDRRLPLAFLGRTLRDLLTTPFAELAATPGIGQKKMASFVQLLSRVANTEPNHLPVVQPAVPADDVPEETADQCDPINVSEMAWAQWRASVVRHGLGGEALGRFAPTLQDMTRVIWNTPLGEYTSSTLAEIRGMRTHGEKRVTAILRVFHAAHTLVAGMGTTDHLVVRIVPRLIDGVERWTGRMLQRPGIPEAEAMRANFIGPLLEQVRIDASRQVVTLAESRLGIGGPLMSVRQAARSLGLTRARVYQLLNEVNDIMMVRWPTGRHQTHELREKFETDQAQAVPSDGAVDLAQFFAAVELFYPGSRRGAAGPLERTFEPDERDGDGDGELVEAEAYEETVP
jgi:hypothetical protein